MKLKGYVQTVIFFSESNGYSIIKFKLTPKCYNENANLERVISAFGNFDRKPFIDEGFIIDGEMVVNPKYGKQFKISSYERMTQKSQSALVGYFSSELFPGIGMVSANQLVDDLGEDLIEKIIEDPSCLKKTHLTEKQQEVIKEGVLKDQNRQKVILFLTEHTITFDMASKIINQLGTDCLDILKINPYLLADSISHFGFEKADSFALSIGIKPDSLVRLQALVKYVLTNYLFMTGNSYIRSHDLYLLMLDKSKIATLTYNDYEKIINYLVNNHDIYVINKNDPQDNLIFDYALYNKENEAGHLLLNRLKLDNVKIYLKEQIDIQFERFVSNQDITYNELQTSAIKHCFENKVMVVTGGPGTGKTTIIKAICAMQKRLSGKGEDYIALLAPTGRAAKRMSEATHIKASTIHRYLGFDGSSFKFDGANKREEELVIVDETSMVDIELFYYLIRSISDKARIILVGDVDQLPSIGPGQVLRDIIESERIFTVKLKEIHRQQEGSSIIKLAQCVNEGYLPDDFTDKKEDMAYLPVAKGNFETAIDDLVSKARDKGYTGVTDLQILIPKYHSETGIDAANQIIQKMVNPPSPSKNEYKVFSTIFREYDKVIQLVNRADKEIMNGDIGIIYQIKVAQGNLEIFIVDFDGKYVEYSKDELIELKLAYAISIHKAQGSEFKLVLLPIFSDYYFMLKRKLIYTAITRAKEKLVIFGDGNLIYQSIKQIETPRITLLKSLLKEENADSGLKPFVYEVPLGEELPVSLIGEEEIKF